jgi:RNA polymerase sigma-70 factor (ECF subfamily)
MGPSVPDVQEQYEELMRTHYAQVVRLCRLLLGDRHEAEDVVQEVFVKLWKECRLPHESMAWGGWLTRVAVHACRDRRRSGWWKWWRAKYTPLQEWHLPGHVVTPEEALMHGEERTRIAQAFQRLSPRQQEVFVLCHLEERSSTEAAELLGLTVGSIKQHLFRAVQHLRQALGEQG